MLERTVQEKRWWNREDVVLLVLLGALFLLPGLGRIPLLRRGLGAEVGDHRVARFRTFGRPAGLLIAQSEILRLSGAIAEPHRPG